MSSAQDPRWAVVTASSQGLGLACAEALALAGVAVCLNGRDRGRLKAAAERLAALAPGVPVEWVAGDLAAPATREQLCEAVPAPDILVLNVGGPAPRPVAEMTAKDWHEAFDALYVPPAELLQRYLPGMRRRGWGRVVAITSSAVRAPLPGLAASTVGRLGLSGLLRCLTAEAAVDGVTLNAILPGRIMTPRQEAAIAREAARAGISEAEQLARFEAAIPAGRLGRAGEVGALCAFLCSAEAGYITGQHVVIDGGALPTLF
ncbi:MAG: SDR family oxidoreductase [Pigmentiphaga sp.]|nr:SDR family oxidoreductase [Pigmentiphaga sp.]